MARIPFARWRGVIPNKTPGAIRSHMGMVMHIEEGTEAGTDSWFHNSKAKVSAHAGVSKSGDCDQWVDSSDEAWAEAAGNPFWFSVEFEGRSGERLTDAQVSTGARIYGWGRNLWDWPPQITDNMNLRGLAWHGMGGAAWGGHYNCPGDPIKAQRPDIIKAAFPPTVTPVLVGGTDMAMPRSIPDFKVPADASGRVPHWDIDEAGNIYCWDGSRQLTSLGKLVTSHPAIMDAFAHPSGDGVTLVGNDGRFENGEWAESTYTILVGM